MAIIKSNIWKELAWMLIAAGIVVLVALYVGGMERIGAMKESLAKQGQTMAELKGRMQIFEGHKVLLIVGTGREVTIRTADGQVLKCYFPDEPIEKGEGQ